jgi:hypothetical protein
MIVQPVSTRGRIVLELELEDDSPTRWNQQKDSSTVKPEDDCPTGGTRRQR